MSCERSKKMIKVGPAGWISSQADELWDEKDYSDLHEIYISHGEKIHSLQFQYVRDKTLFLSDPYGQANGPKFNLIKLDYPSEFVTGISGHYQTGGGRLSSLTFTTNKGTYGPFGRPLNIPNNFEFQLGADGRHFGGFYGHIDRSYSCISAIGIYFKPSTSLATKHENAISIAMQDFSPV